MADDADLIATIHDRLNTHVVAGQLPGLAWLVSVGDHAHTGVLGAIDPEQSLPVRPDLIFRISSMTKPVVAAAALILIEDGVLSLDEPIDRLLPELADRRVLREPAAALDDTVPASRPITVDDLLTLRLGWGMDFTDFSPKPFDRAWGERELGFGPPQPGRMPTTDVWVERLGELPLQFQPGERWLYHVGSNLLGVLVARAAGRPLSELLAERVFAPLGMIDTGFFVPEEKWDRFGPHFAPTDNGLVIFDPAEGQWSRQPPFEGGGEGLVTTLADYHRFALMLRQGGSHHGLRILSESSVAAMISNQLTDDQLARGGPSPDGSTGWGYGLGVALRDSPEGPPAGAYGWPGGLGSTWTNAGTVTGILLTSVTWSNSGPPPVFNTFESIIGDLARSRG